MKPEWKNFLIDAGAELNDNRVASFGNPIREQKLTHTGDIICDLSHYGVIAAYGDDVVDFLQGQVTNDVSKVNLSHCQLAGLCSPKGRMLSNFRIFQRKHTYYLVLPYEMLETTLNRLRMFVMRAKVSLEDADDALMRFGLNGANAASLLQDVAGKIPQAVDEVVETSGYTILRVAGVQPRFEIYGLLDDMKKLWQSLDVDAAPVGANVWELLNIQAGIPVIVAQTSEAFVPQMANMELINGVSFKKGCYTGQEIVARMHYLGKLKRRMYRILIDTDDVPTAGDKLVTSDSNTSQEIGTLVNAQHHPDKGVEALAVIQIKSAEQDTLKLHNADGASVVVQELPYSLTSEEKNS